MPSIKKINRIGVVILGMHRAGTSALARVLNFLGCDLPANLLDAGLGNETGHWEPQAMVSLNERILVSSGSYAHDWLAIQSEWFESPKASAFLEQAADVIRTEFRDSRLFVVKDPRLCRLFPLWKEAFKETGVRPLVIIPIRNPIEVADSLNRRDGFDVSWGYLAWLRNVLEAERDSRGIPRFFTTYEMLLDNWGKVATASQAALGIKWPVSLDKAAPNVERFLSKERRHHVSDSSNLLDNPLISPWLKDVYSVMLRWAQVGENTSDHAILDRVREEVETVAPAFGRAVAAGWGAALWGRQLEQSQAELKTELESASQAATEREIAIEGLDQRVRELEATVAEHEERAALAQKVEADRDRLADEATRLALRIGELEATVAEHEERAALAQKVEADRDRLADEATRLALRIGELEATVAEHEERAALAQKVEADRDRAFAEVARLTHALRAAELRLAERFDEIVKFTEILQRAEADRDEVAAKLRETVSDAAATKVRTTELHHRIIEAITGSGGSAFLPRSIRTRLPKLILERTGLFEADWYRANYPDVAAANIDPLDHFVHHGAREGRYWSHEISTLADDKARLNAIASTES